MLCSYFYIVNTKSCYNVEVELEEGEKMKTMHKIVLTIAIIAVTAAAFLIFQERMVNL